MRGAFAVLLALAAASRSAAQTSEPLRKTDLIRLLTGGALSHGEIADLIGRNCLSFTPTARDRLDLTALGADSLILARMAGCGRGRATALAAKAGPTPATTPPPAPVPGVAIAVVPLQSRVTAEVGTDAIVAVALRRGAQPVPAARLVLRGSGSVGAATAGGGGADAIAVTDARGIASFRLRAAPAPFSTSLTVVAADGTTLSGQTTVEFITVPAARAAPVPVTTTRPSRAVRPSPTGTGWVAGASQRGIVGRRAAVPLIFEARDSTGAPIAGVPVALAVANGRLLAPPDRTDSAGGLWVDLEFGPRAAATTVTATLGALVRQATLYPAAGPPARLLVLRGRDTVTQRLQLDPDVATSLLVVPTDAFGNPAPVRGLLAAVGDGSVLKVAEVTTDSLGGHVTLRPGRAGGSATNLAVQASGLRTDLTASVRARRP
ncbi:MAG: hypothetical protein DMD29_03980 [Gemmatimonadetes bacterium]|nr:MAG: hypothetical protein AUG10_00860 [Gemmatimonadetes bacterium 13_1_20CM_2_70_10]PYO42063.1 MAG: hypothetical protein DMD29_03980 [Gemmatimonadota bacterium]